VTMTTTVEVIGAVLGTGLVSTVGTGLVAWRNSGNARDQALLAGMDKLVGTLQGALDKNIARADAKAEAEAKALRLVGEMAGRIEHLEVAANRVEERLAHTEQKLSACEHRDATNTSEMKRLRERLLKVERTTSDPGVAAVSSTEE
jgi:hypothetical protein